MLSFAGRAAVRRVVGSGPQSTNRALQGVWPVQRVAGSQHTNKTSSRNHVLFLYSRSYATTTKAAPKPKSKSTTAAKPRAKKAPAKKKTVKKAALKKKPVKKKVVKVLTEEQKQKASIKELKAKALKIPKMKPANTWSVFLAQEFSDGVTGSFGEQSKRNTEKWKSLTPAELETLNHTANQNKAANEISYKEWVESHTPDQINTANNARLQLRKKLQKSYPAITDTRLPRRPASARAFFIKDRYDSGDLKGISFSEASKLLTSEYKALSPSEKKTYEDRAEAGKLRYLQEYKTVFHRDSRSKKHQQS